MKVWFPLNALFWMTDSQKKHQFHTYYFQKFFESIWFNPNQESIELYGVKDDRDLSNLTNLDKLTFRGFGEMIPRFFTFQKPLKTTQVLSNEQIYALEEYFNKAIPISDQLFLKWLAYWHNTYPMKQESLEKILTHITKAEYENCDNDFEDTWDETDGYPLTRVALQDGSTDWIIWNPNGSRDNSKWVQQYRMFHKVEINKNDVSASFLTYVLSKVLFKLSISKHNVSKEKLKIWFDKDFKKYLEAAKEKDISKDNKPVKFDCENILSELVSNKDLTKIKIPLNIIALNPYDILSIFFLVRSFGKFRKNPYAWFYYEKDMSKQDLMKQILSHIFINSLNSFIGEKSSLFGEPYKALWENTEEENILINIKNYIKYDDKKQIYTIHIPKINNPSKLWKLMIQIIHKFNTIQEQKNNSTSWSYFANSSEKDAMFPQELVD